MRRSDSYHSLGDNDASGYIGSPVGMPGSGFTEISVIHRSAHNLVLKAKRYGRWWILKCIGPDAFDATSEAALRKEFEVSLLLPRESVANVYAMENVGGYGPCIIMDYVEGPTLQEWLLETHTGAEREKLALDIVDAVGLIHGSGVVHRDIKPSNIIVRSLGQRAVLIDFGLADTAQHACFKHPAGTRRYMAPEQASASTPDIRNDIYSLGAVLEEMKLPGYWRPAIRKCLRPIDSRLPDTSSLLKTLGRSRRFRRLLPAGVFFIALAGIMTGIWPLIRPTPAVDPVLAHRADSLSRTLDSLRTENNGHIARLNANLQFITDSIAKSRHTEEIRKKELKAAIEREKAVLDRIWKETGMKYLDTVDRSGFIANIYSTGPMDREAQEYIRRASGHYSSEELLVITDELNRKIKSNLDLWIQRRNRISSAY